MRGRKKMLFHVAWGRRWEFFDATSVRSIYGITAGHLQLGGRIRVGINHITRIA